MKTLTRKAYARAGLLGNPSDGYHGKTISLIVRNFCATTTLVESNRLEIIPDPCEQLSFDSVAQLTRQINDRGYYDGIRLIKAAIKRFDDYCRLSNQKLDGPNFAIQFRSNIPRQVGLAGSSAIVTATLKALREWYNVELPPHLMASLTLSAETELGIPAGLQDRVIQAYEGIVYMDFAKPNMSVEHGLAFGQYRESPTDSLPSIFIAYTDNAGQPTEVLHNDLKKRFASGDPQIINAMQQFGQFAQEGEQAIESGDVTELGRLIDANFDLRNEICQLHGEHVRMIKIARQAGASAKYCGSGGAIIGTFESDEVLNRLTSSMEKVGCQVILPQIQASEILEDSL